MRNLTISFIALEIDFNLLISIACFLDDVIGDTFFIVQLLQHRSKLIHFDDRLGTRNLQIGVSLNATEDIGFFLSKCIDLLQGTIFEYLQLFQVNTQLFILLN
uniref:Putative secreted protein n=1 Tax=Anopheles darlingi TaxID=43151 RepID=A0A2M4DHH2_ANODA